IPACPAPTTTTSNRYGSRTKVASISSLDPSAAPACTEGRGVGLPCSWPCDSALPLVDRNRASFSLATLEHPKNRVGHGSHCEHLPRATTAAIAGALGNRWPLPLPTRHCYPESLIEPAKLVLRPDFRGKKPWLSRAKGKSPLREVRSRSLARSSSPATR